MAKKRFSRVLHRMHLYFVRFTKISILVAALLQDARNSGKIAGSCFYHPRKTHMSLGIMNVSPDFFGQGIARSLLTKIIQMADDQSLPVRLVPVPKT